MLIHVINECDPADKKGKMGYAGFSAALNILMLFVCLFMLFKGKKVVKNAAVAGKKATVAANAAIQTQSISHQAIR